MSDKIKFVITRERFDELFSIDEYLYFNELTQREVYEKMLLFAADENGQLMTREQAREAFKKIPKKEFIDYGIAFMEALKNTFVDPTNGGS